MSCSHFVLFILALSIFTGCSPSSKPLEPQGIWNLISPSVVRVEAQLLNGDQMQGSGFICEMDGKKYILTNKHVVRGAKEVRVGYTEAKLVKASGYHTSRDIDLAIIEMPDNFGGNCLKTRKDEVRVGEKIFALGFPLGLNKSITQGIVSSQTKELLQFDAPISSGNSGGPLVDENGSVIGIVTLGSGNGGNEIVQNLNFAIKTSIVPNTQMFNDPIFSFYKAWLELVETENKLIDNLNDLQVFELEEYLSTKIALLEFDREYNSKSGDLTADQKAGFVANYKALKKETLDDPLARLIKRHGSLENAVSMVNSYLLKQSDEFNRIPELFADINSDELLTAFASNTHTNNYFAWDIKPSDIVPLLKISIEFSKGKYEDKAFQISFLYRATQKMETSDITFSNAFRNKLSDSKSVGERQEIRLPYKSINANSPDDDWVKMYGLSLQKPKCSYEFKPSGLSLRGESLKKVTEAYGGFEDLVAAVFEKISIATLENDSPDAAIGLMRNEVAIRKYPDLVQLAFFYSCNSDFDKAYTKYQEAFSSLLAQVDPFTLECRSKLAFFGDLFNSLLDSGKRQIADYSPRINNNLLKWQSYIVEKPAYALTQLPVRDAIESSEFKKLNDFEKGWVIFVFGREALHSAEQQKSFLEILHQDKKLEHLYNQMFSLN